MFFAWSSMCIGWLFKLVILRYGGTQLYNKLRPLFLGMVMGEVTHQGIWMAIDYLTGSIGTVHRW